MSALPVQGEPRRPTGLAFASLRTLHSNLGDGLIIHALIRSLLEGNRRVLLQAGGVPDTFIRFVLSGLDVSRIELVHDGYWRLALMAAVRYRARRPRGRNVSGRPVLVLTPGHQFLDLGLRSAARKALYGCMLLVLRMCGLRIGRAGFSLEPPTTVVARALERVVGGVCSFYAVRDSFSLEVARSVGIDHARLEPDLAVLVRRPDRRVGPHATCIGVSIRGHGSDDVRLPAAVSSIFRGLDGGPLDVVAISQTGEDLPATRRCLEHAHLEVAEEIELQTSIETIDELLGHYQRYQLVISNRLHVVLAALAAGTPSVAVVDRRANVKVIAALEAIGIEGIVLATDADRASIDPPMKVPDLLENAARASVVLEDPANQLRTVFQEFLGS